MSTPNFDNRYAKPADVSILIAAQAVTDAGQYAAVTALSDITTSAGGALKSAIGFITPENYGAKGDGSTDDTAAIQNWLNACVSSGMRGIAKNGAVYKVSQSTTKTFYNGTGGTVPANICISIPNGLTVDFNGSIIKANSSYNGVIVCNANPSLTAADRVKVRNLIVDGGGANPSRSYPMVWMLGLLQSVLTITVQNTSYIGAVIGACSQTDFSRLHVTGVVGQGMMLGTGLSDLNDECSFGLITGDNCADFGTFNQPGNAYCLGVTRSSIERIINRNCAGGIKYLKGCDDVHTMYAEFDGSVLTGETNNATQNSGIKAQGDSTTDKCGKVTFGKIVTRQCGGAGLYVRYATTIVIDSYVGTKNGRLGLNYEWDLGEFSYFTAGDMVSDSAGFGGFVTNSGSGSYRIGRLVGTNFGDVTSANSYGFAPIYGDGRVNYLEMMDNRGTQVAGKAIHGISDVTCVVDNYRTNIGNRIDIRSTRIFLGNPILSTGNASLIGTFGPAASATYTDVTNANSYSQNQGGGWSEPIIELTPLNSSAASLVVRSTFPTNFQFRVVHAAAVGTEVFQYRIVGYTFRLSKAS